MLLAGMAGQAMAQIPVGGGSIYTCTDGKGRRITSDRPISECTDREQRELGPSGNIRRSIGPTLTEIERTAVDEQRRKEYEAKERADDDIRRDRSLLARYPHQGLHDIERANALRPFDESIGAANLRVNDLNGRRKALDAELGVYQKDPAKAPASLKRQSSDNLSMMDLQLRFIAEQNVEKARINKRFDAELARLRQLWQPGAPAAAVISPGSSNLPVAPGIKPVSASAAH